MLDSKHLLSFIVLVVAAACSVTQSGQRSDEEGAGGTQSGDGDGAESGGEGGDDGSGGTSDNNGSGGDDGSGGEDGAGGSSNGAGGTPSGPPYGHPDPTATYPTYDGFTLYVVEEFEEALDLDTDPIWTYSDGGISEGDVRYGKESIQFENGRMILEAAEGTTAASCSHAENALVSEKNLTSGELRSRYNMFRYGRYEARLKAPSPHPFDSAVNGNYISTLFLFRTPRGEEWREIGLELTGDDVDTITTILISADGTTMWNPDIQDPLSTSYDGINARTEFHNYAIEWLPHRIAWYVDGEEIRSYGNGEKLSIPELSAKVIMNLWIFNGSAAYGGSEIENNVYPMYAEYEWFRFYRWDDDTAYPCEGMDTSCLASEDLNLSSNNPCDGIDPSGQTCEVACQ